MIDNFEQIKTLLQFDSEDDFYFLQIIKRKKEHPELGSNSHVIKTYYIRSNNHLETCKEEIINLCTFHNARGCINLNRRSFEKCAFQTLRKVTDIIMNKDYKSVRRAYDSVCGSISNEPNKKWIIDIDLEDDGQRGGWLASLLHFIKPVGTKLIASIPTKNGYHLITVPFNIQEAKILGLSEDIHKDNPTILFIP